MQESAFDLMKLLTAIIAFLPHIHGCHIRVLSVGFPCQICHIKLEENTRNFHFWYITDGKLTGMRERSSVESCDPDQPQSIQTLLILLSGAADVSLTPCSMCVPTESKGWI
jgi:hypothetical protein